MNLTIAQVAVGLAILDGRQEPNPDDHQLAKIAHPHLIELPEPTDHDVAVADQLLAELGIGGGRHD